MLAFNTILSISISTIVISAANGAAFIHPRSSSSSCNRPPFMLASITPPQSSKRSKLVFTPSQSKRKRSTTNIFFRDEESDHSSFDTTLSRSSSSKQQQREQESSSKTNATSNNNNNNNTPRTDFQSRMKNLVVQQRRSTTSTTASSPSRSRRRQQQIYRPTNVMTAISLEEFGVIIEKGRNENKVVVVRFYATWCKKCHSLRPSFDKAASTNPNVLFVDVPVLETNSNLHQGLGVQSVPFGHIYHPTKGLVVETKLSRSTFSEFEEMFKKTNCS